MMEATLLEIDVDLIDPNPEQPRVHFDETALRELGESIVAHGLEQAITVEIQDNGRYLLRDGERRLRAHKLMGLKTVLALVKLPPQQDTKRERLVGAFVANFQRQPLNPIEEARALKRMSSELGMSYQDIADRLGMKKSTVGNKIRLLALPDDWQNAVIAGLVSERQAAAFLPWLSLPDEIKEDTARPVWLLWNETIEEGKSSEQIRRELSTIIYPASKTLDRVVWFDTPIDDPFCAQTVCRGCPHSIESANTRLGCVNLACFGRKLDRFRLTAQNHADQLGVPMLPDGVQWYETTIHYNQSVDEIAAVPCPNRAVLAYPWLTITTTPTSGMIEPGIFLVCDKRPCSCVSHAKRSTAQNGTQPQEPVKSFWLHITTGDREWVVERGGQGVRLSISDVLEIVNRYCDEHGLETVSRANRLPTYDVVGQGGV